MARTKRDVTATIAAAATPARRSAAREFMAGAGLVWQGFGMWTRRPGLMLLGMVPALIVFAVLATAVVLLATHVETIAAAVTPFADDWADGTAALVRLFVAAAILIAALVLAFVSFTALTLIVGEPFYERIWRAAESELGDFEETPLGFWRSAGDAVKLLFRSLGTGILTALVGLVPLIGQIASPVLGVFANGHILARELTGRSFEARGQSVSARRAVLRGHRARELGFGVMTQLCFLVPGGAILVMPAAVVGATRLARQMLDPAARTPGAAGAAQTPGAAAEPQTGG